jgi:hypothetical protein
LKRYQAPTSHAIQIRMSTETRFYDLDEKDDWITPPELVEDIDQALYERREASMGIDLDPCPHEHVGYGNINYWLEDGDDGLEKDWFGDVFVNPPFSYKAEWLEKAVDEVVGYPGAQCVVMITPDGTDTKSWWHKYIAEHAKYVCFLKGRLSYCVYDESTDELVKHNRPTFGTAISVFGEPTDELIDTLQSWGHVVETVEG